MDKLPFKENWGETEYFLRRWWTGERLLRPAISITAPRPQRVPVPRPADLETWRTDSDFVLRETRVMYQNTYFCAEAIPARTLMVGYAVLGGEPHFDANTVWHSPTIHDWRTDATKRYDCNNPWWLNTKKIVSVLTEREVGFPPMPAILTPLDALSTMRGPQQLCTDLLTEPQTVKKYSAYLIGIWIEMFDQLYEITCTKYEGSTGWLTVWAPGKYSTIQCDFSCMISPAMFEEFVLPEVEALCNHLDFTIYHLDGPGALQHLDALLRVPKLHGIQWVPGSGAAPAIEWTELLRKVQNAGKRLHISLDNARVQRALKDLSPEGLYLATSCATMQEANELFAFVKSRCRSPI
jgi:hypothetical protein